MRVKYFIIKNFDNLFSLLRKKQWDVKLNANRSSKEATDEKSIFIAFVLTKILLKNKHMLNRQAITGKLKICTQLLSGFEKHSRSHLLHRRSSNWSEFIYVRETSRDICDHSWLNNENARDWVQWVVLASFQRKISAIQQQTLRTRAFTEIVIREQS